MNAFDARLQALRIAYHPEWTVDETLAAAHRFYDFIRGDFLEVDPPLDITEAAN